MEADVRSLDVYTGIRFAAVWRKKRREFAFNSKATRTGGLPFFTRTLFYTKLRTEGFEPSPLAGQDPKSCVSADSTTSAMGYIRRRFAAKAAQSEGIPIYTISYVMFTLRLRRHVCLAASYEQAGNE